MGARCSGDGGLWLHPEGEGSAAPQESGDLSGVITDTRNAARGGCSRTGAWGLDAELTGVPDGRASPLG